MEDENKNIVLDEYTELNSPNCQVLTEETTPGHKTYKIRGCFSKAGIKNKNGRIYPIPVMEHAVNEAQKMINENRFVCQLEHPASAKIDIAEIAAKINSIKLLEDGSVVGEMNILDTPKGKIVKTLIDEGIKLGVSTRGTGSVKKTKMKLDESGVEEDILEVQPDFLMRAIDIVFDPSAGEFGSPDFLSEEANLKKKNSRKFIDIWKNAFN